MGVYHRSVQRNPKGHSPSKLSRQALSYCYYVYEEDDNSDDSRLCLMQLRIYFALNACLALGV